MWQTDVLGGAKAIGYKKLVDLYDINAMCEFFFEKLHIALNWKK